MWRDTICSVTLHQGRGVEAETGVGVGWSRPFWLESEVESVKFVRLRLLPGVADKHTAVEYDFGRAITQMYPPKNTEILEKERRVAVCK